ncbi:MAG: TerD family protein [Lachnospiraceae bacterium]|nr:TerD family protein [Lachnospiraceae bacterium]MBR6150319.1 TerD family protein [Lachnospiraceae bacterium]
MKKIFKEYLFQKHMFVCENAEAGLAVNEEPHVFETLFSLANLFGISITEGKELAQKGMIEFASEMLGKDVPSPFYQGFPESVRKLSADQLLFDQLVHYTVTYGFGHFSEPGHSLFEETFERMAFKENVEVKEFVIVEEAAAVKLLAEYVENLLASSRPLSDAQFAMICDYIQTYRYKVQQCASKNTLVRLMVALRDLRFARFLDLSDAIKVLDEINFVCYGNENLKKLNLRNRDRKFLTSVIDELFAISHVDVITCYEKKDVWCGLLHHLHYQPKCDRAREFLADMRGQGNKSVYASFERLMNAGNIRGAVTTLKEGKGSGALLRNLDYIISRIEEPEDLNFVLQHLETKNNVMLMQLLLHYVGERNGEGHGRAFRFVRHNTMRVHAELPKEVKRRKSVISHGQSAVVARFVEENLRKNLRGRLGKVYVSEDMKKIALPLQEATAQGGIGVLAKGSRLAIPAGKKLRAFTYWEKVDDIDLSVIGMDEEGLQTEFSWRTMATNQSGAITYSGDETSGYNGGSEYFDIDLEKFHELYPAIKKLIFCDNVFTGVNFENCFCTAGFMMRDLLDSGEIYEPKTVESAFRVNCPSMFAYLFGIDLEKREFVWLNLNRDAHVTVAGTTSLAFLLDYFDVTEKMNVYRFFEWMATELVTDPAQADVIVSDRREVWEQANAITADDQKSGDIEQSEKEWIRSFDFEKFLALMNQK